MSDATKVFILLLVVTIVLFLFLYVDSLLEARREAKEWQLQIKKHQEFLEFLRIYNSPAYFTKDSYERFLEAYREWKSNQDN